MSYTRIWYFGAPQYLIQKMVPPVGVAFLRKSHGGCNMPPAYCQEPPFNSERELRGKKWCLRSELNQRHADFQSAALPTELQRHVEPRNSRLRCVYMATRNGLEPSTSSVTGWRANRLHHRAKLSGGNNRARTCDPMLVRHVLSQLSYAPELPHISDGCYYTH